MAPFKEVYCTTTVKIILEEDMYFATKTAHTAKGLL